MVKSAEKLIESLHQCLDIFMSKKKYIYYFFTFIQYR